MTEAGEKWAKNQMLKSWGFVPDSEVDLDEGIELAESWILAFCAEVEKRAKRLDGVLIVVGIEDAFDELKRELLGE